MEAGVRERHGTVTFVGVLFLLAGAYNVLIGFICLEWVGNAEASIDLGELPAWDLDTWGVILLIVGVIQIVTSVGVLARLPWGRPVGIALAAIGAFLVVFFSAAAEGWAFTVLVLDLVTIYVLSHHREEFAARA